jgi:hypothetical protein
MGKKKKSAEEETLRNAASGENLKKCTDCNMH